MSGVSAVATNSYSQWDEYREQRQDNADAAANDAAIGPAIYIGAPPYPANELDSNPEPWTPYYVACCACGHVECRPGPPSLTWPTKCETCGRTDQIDGPHDDPADAYDICDRYPEEHGTHPYHDHGPRYEGD